MELKASVRDIVDYACQSGDIRSLSLGTARAVDGIKAHQKIQKRFAKEYDAYQAEVNVSHQFVSGDITLSIRGRLDGLFQTEQGMVVDEIKSTSLDLGSLEVDPKHIAQAKFYAYIVAKERGLESIGVQLTYVKLKSFEIHQIVEPCSMLELEGFFTETVECYLDMAREMAKYQKKKNQSIEVLPFPYESYRKGQRKLMNGVYHSVMEDRKLFARAPTGIGKTLATLFPAIKTLPLRPGKIFYLTAKTIGREVAFSALNQLEHKGLILKRINITAKDKICLSEEKICDAKACIYADGHYDRVLEALKAILDASNCYDRETIVAYAKKYRVCPYELSLDLTQYCDCIVCDYNYAFDPSSSLRRYFSDEPLESVSSEDARYLFLIDEAHNLIDRARQMYSSELSKKHILTLKKLFHKQDAALYRYLNKMNQFLIEKRKECLDTEFLVEEDYPEEFCDLARGVVYRTEKIYSTLSEKKRKDALLDFYFACRDFLKKVELYDGHYRTYYRKDKNELILKLYCVDPKENIKKYMDNAQSSILFSATLSPLDYFKQALGAEESSYGMVLETPFCSDNLLLMIQDRISTKYRDRDRTAGRVAESILQVAKSKIGNYIAFFPSYRYLEQVYSIVETRAEKEIELLKQETGLDEFAKKEFLASFEDSGERTLLAFAVLGGMFAEGIDLRGEKLSGAIVVGVGLPAMDIERELIKEYFNGASKDGFQQAYVIPGMNKVLQAAGRVIRQETDRGVVLLIGSRFSQAGYKKLFPPEWYGAKGVAGEIAEEVYSFWDKGGEKSG